MNIVKQWGPGAGQAHQLVVYMYFQQTFLYFILRNSNPLQRKKKKFFLLLAFGALTKNSFLFSAPPTILAMSLFWAGRHSQA